MACIDDRTVNLNLKITYLTEMGEPNLESSNLKLGLVSN